MPQPTKIPRAFAASGDKNTIPDSTGSIGLASWTEGFPAITSTPFAQGGVAPKRADFNGIFNSLSAATVWQQQGGFYAYDNTTNYEVGNIVLYSGELYKCLVANGPNSSVFAPTNTTYWGKIILDSTASDAVIPDVSASNSGYIRFANGVQFVWDRLNIPSASKETGVAITYAVPFYNEPRTFGNTRFASAYGQGFGVQFIDRTSTGCTAITGSSSGGGTPSYSSGEIVYLAVGRWK